MSSPYNTRLAPGIGRGLPGLPVRGDAIQQVSGHSRTSASEYEQADAFYEDVGIDVPFPLSTYRPQNSGARPVRGSLNLGLLRLNKSSGSPSDALVGFRYDKDGIELGDPLDYAHANEPLLSEVSLSLPDGSFVSAISSTQLVRLKVDPDTLEVTRTNFATLRGSTLASGGSFSLRSGGGSGNVPYYQMQEHQESAPVPLTLTDDGRVLALVVGLHESLEWVICIELDLNGGLINAHRLFTLNQPATAQVRGGIVQIGQHYSVVAYVPGAASSTRYVYVYKYLVSKDFTKLVSRLNGSSVSGATSVVSRTYVSGQYALTFCFYDNTVRFALIEEVDETGMSVRQITVNLSSVASTYLYQYTTRAISNAVVPPGSNLAIAAFSASTYTASSTYTLAARGLITNNSTRANDLGWVFNATHTHKPRQFFQFTSFGLVVSTAGAFNKAYPLEQGLFLVLTTDSLRLLEPVP